MKLFEFEGKGLYKSYGIAVPEGKVFFAKDSLAIPNLKNGYVVKAQITAGKRGVSGGVFLTQDKAKASEFVQSLFSKVILGFPVEQVLVEEKQDFQAMYYLSISFDTIQRCPALAFSKNGGIDIEKMHDIHTLLIPTEFSVSDVKVWLQKQGFPEAQAKKFSDLAEKAFQCFVKEDLRILEINPLMELKSGGLVACDAKVMTDDDSAYRHKERTFPARNEFGRKPTVRELEAKKIDQDDYRGVGGKYTELEGDIAMLTAGGGASLTNMDALLAYGGKPANYTEYSGNPPTEKVYKLTKLILSKPGIVGCWHVGGTANNTQLDVTMKGFAQALEELKPEFPIVVRRDGPNKIEGFKILEEAKERLHLNMNWYDKNTTMTETAKVLMEMIQEYKQKKGLQ